MTSLRKSKRIRLRRLILVTHDMNSVKKYCSRGNDDCRWRSGSIGDPETVSQQYTLANLEAEEKAERKRQEERGGYPNGLNERCPLLRTIAVSPKVCTSADMFRFDVEYQYDEPGDFLPRHCVA